MKSVCFQMGYNGLTPRHNKVTCTKKIAKLQRKDVFEEKGEKTHGLLCRDTKGIMLGGFSVLTTIRSRASGVPQSKFLKHSKALWRCVEGCSTALRGYVDYYGRLLLAWKTHTTHNG